MPDDSSDEGGRSEDGEVSSGEDAQRHRADSPARYENGDEKRRKHKHKEKSHKHKSEKRRDTKQSESKETHDKNKDKLSPSQSKQGSDKPRPSPKRSKRSNSSSPSSSRSRSREKKQRRGSRARSASAERHKEREKERVEREKRDKEREREEREKREREREREKREREEREKDREREREREREERRRRERDDRKRSRSRSKSRHKDSSKKEKDKEKEKAEAEPRKKTPQEVAADKQAEREYKERVEAQLKRMAHSDDDEDESKQKREADERRKRREAILAKFSAKKPEADPEKEPESPARSPSPVDVEMHPTKEMSAHATLAALTERMEDEANKDRAIRQAQGDELPDMFGEFEASVPADDPKKQGGVELLKEELVGEDGYYKFRLGDVLDGRYKVVGAAGRGVFSIVLRVRDTLYGNRELVVKVIRNNEVMRKAGEQELNFLKEIKLHDPEGKKNCVALESSFDHAGHLCLVFEAMDRNLREVVKKLGGVGLNIRAVRKFSKQMFTALRHLKKLKILHGDIKPDNILVNESMTGVKVCDFGSAGYLDKCELTPYLVSRFYRPPEIMLGMPYDEQVDMWSVGCVIYELYTGKILFPGENNNDMLKLIMQLKGPFPSKKLKKAEFVDKHFDKELKFRLKSVDPLSKKTLVDFVRIVKPEKDLLEMLSQHTPVAINPADRKKLPQLADLLEKIFILDPERRLKVEDALNHPFIKEDPQPGS